MEPACDSRLAEFVRQYLRAEHIALVSEGVLGIHPRKLCYFPATGRALVKRLAHAHPQVLPTQMDRGDSVDLF